MAINDDYSGTVTRSMVQRAIDEALSKFQVQLVTGQIQIPTAGSNIENHAGGGNHWPNNDASFSTRAATIAGTLPTDAFDDNYELWGFYWAERDAAVVMDAAHALKSVDHSLFAANEGVNTGIPIWDRVNGRVLMGAAGATQYDVVVALPRKIVGPGERWYIVFQVVAVTNDDVPPEMEAFGGMWQISDAYENYAKGDAFDLSYIIKGVAGAHDTKYRALAKTDSGFSILSSVLDVPDAPAVLSNADYPQIYLNGAPGFLEYAIYRLRDAVYEHLYTIRNDQDLLYNDTGTVHFPDEVLAGWPVEPQDRPIAYANTGGGKTLKIGVFGGQYQNNSVLVVVPTTYRSGDTHADGQFIRFGLMEPTTADRQLAFDKFVFDTSYHIWSPDNAIQFAQENFTIPSSSPNSGAPATGGVFGPPDPGSGGDIGNQKVFEFS